MDIYSEGTLKTLDAFMTEKGFKPEEFTPEQKIVFIEEDRGILVGMPVHGSRARFQGLFVFGAQLA